MFKPARTLLATAVLVAVVTLLGAGSASATPVTFRFQPPGAAQSVSLAGSFNDWSTSAAPLADRGGVWEATIELAPGSYQYKFVVNGNQWLTDESAKSFADDGFGGKNSVVEVGEQAMTVGAASVAAQVSGGRAAPPPPAGLTRVTFRFQPRGTARTVCGPGTCKN